MTGVRQFRAGGAALPRRCGLELLLDSGLQGCVVDFDGHGWLLGFKGTGMSVVNEQKPRRDGAAESRKREAGAIPSVCVGLDFLPSGSAMLGFGILSVDS
jgi:hypothetical protein